MFADGNRQLLERLDALELPGDRRAAVKAFMWSPNPHRHPRPSASALTATAHERAGVMSLTMVGPTRDLDLARMRRERHARLQQAMREQGIDALLLLTSGNVMYSAGPGQVMSYNGR